MVTRLRDGHVESIKVAVRARPLNQRERSLGCSVVVSMSGKTVTMGGERNLKHFTYDFTYWSLDPGRATQADVFADIGSQMLSNAVNGFNCTLFAYGQTGSGKSYTMMGQDDDPGVIPRMIDDLFREKAALEQKPLQELQVRISYLEIYKEQITDLFGQLQTSKVEHLKVMEHPNLGVYVKGLHTMPCETKQDVMGNLEYGLKLRTIATTNMNQNSSRSHAVFTILVNRLEGAKPQTGKKDERKSLHAKINLIDLAGSERTSKARTESERLKEGCAINQSLSQLGLVIKSLTDRTEGLPVFRASKLTFLLKDSLAGNSKTCMMAAISPASDNYDETLSTLRFASSVKAIETVAVQNKDKKDQLIENLQQEMQLLKAQMAAGGLNVAEASEQLRERERLIKEQLQQDFQEELKVARDVKTAREKALEENGLSHGHITQAFGITDQRPYLVNMAFDPMLAGCLIYLIQEDKPTTMGAHRDCSIILKGVGMPDFLCRLEALQNQASALSITRLDSGARVAVNGKTLEQGQARELQNGDKIFLGRTYVLRLVCPRQCDAPLQPRDLVLEIEEEDSQLDKSPAWTSLEDYIAQVVRQMSDSAATALLKEIKTACRYTDEANELTLECRPDVACHFEVDLTSTFPPCVAIRVLDCPKGQESASEEDWKNKYIWSVEQLSERLERMRDYWRGCQNNDGHRAELQALEDPWHEAEPAEIFQRMRHLESIADEAQKAFRAAQYEQPWISRMVSSETSLLRLSFGLWKSSVKAWKQERKASNGGRTALVKSVRGMRTTIVPANADRHVAGELHKHPEMPAKEGKQVRIAGYEEVPHAEPEATPEKRVALDPPKSPKESTNNELLHDEREELHRQLRKSREERNDLEKQLKDALDLCATLCERMQATSQAEVLQAKSQAEVPRAASQAEVLHQATSQVEVLQAKPQAEVLQVSKEERHQSQARSMPQHQKLIAEPVTAKPSSPSRSKESSALARADALAAATRAAVDAAKAIQLAKAKAGLPAQGPWEGSMEALSLHQRSTGSSRAASAEKAQSPLRIGRRQVALQYSVSVGFRSTASSRAGSADAAARSTLKVGHQELPLHASSRAVSSTSPGPVPCHRTPHDQQCVQLPVSNQAHPPFAEPLTTQNHPCIQPSRQQTSPSSRQPRSSTPPPPTCQVKTTQQRQYRLLPQQLQLVQRKSPEEANWTWHCNGLGASASASIAPASPSRGESVQKAVSSVSVTSRPRAEAEASRAVEEPTEPPSRPQAVLQPAALAMPKAWERARAAHVPDCSESRSDGNSMTSTPGCTRRCG
eukprot:TRINITY_DN27194_c0_g2_i1.p1 TRINITY_DN27194_c0_g2~~TRINITY_DN27194_c0_g2_i1.p1  ORF type:complete len:1301 (+),score=288.37 TRINITY_DN27194_c0_g2_i1:89-3991(+)